ncbi:MAG: type II toxin-antitoxin system VapC family toxin [Endozoicomonas sp.]|uniref:type II toxin-antitoxin system VapC family toxin n=1 Tax=Endozoicomonas sp. TaxID=1892382 RepID=UPI003D9AF84F
MTRTLFLDADVILDLMAMREPWFINSAKIFSLIQSGHYKGATSVVVFANIFYILRKLNGSDEARNTLHKLKSLLTVLPTSEASLEQALNSTFKDFEDGIQYFTGQNAGADLLLTRNIKDYKCQDLPVMTPEQFLESIECH